MRGGCASWPAGAAGRSRTAPSDSTPPRPSTSICDQRRMRAANVPGCAGRPAALVVMGRVHRPRAVTPTSVSGIPAPGRRAGVADIVNPHRHEGVGRAGHRLPVTGQEPALDTDGIDGMDLVGAVTEV